MMQEVIGGGIDVGCGEGGLGTGWYGISLSNFLGNVAGRNGGEGKRSSVAEGLR